jgi:hypothetical protein
VATVSGAEDLRIEQESPADLRVIGEGILSMTSTCFKTLFQPQSKGFYFQSHNVVKAATGKCSSKLLSQVAQKGRLQVLARQEVEFGWKTQGYNLELEEEPPKLGGRRAPTDHLAKCQLEQPQELRLFLDAAILH